MLTPSSRQRPLPPTLPDSDAAAIGELYRSGKASLVDSVNRFIEAGKRLKAKRDSLHHGEWLPWLEANADALGFESRFTAAKLMKLAANVPPAAHLTEAEALTISRQLWGHDDDPPADLDSLPRDEDGRLTPEARKALAPIIKEIRTEKVEAKKAIRSEREAALAGKQLALPSKKYGVVYADPEWRFDTWSEAGKNASAENHYPTSTLDVIRSRNVEGIAADDAALFLWGTVPMLPQALDVMAAWGFTYRSSFVWVKPKAGTGYWNRNRHELLLVGTRGNIPAPALGDQWESVIEAPTGRHSEKPVQVYDLIEDYYPTLPKIELNARQGREGWDRWGNEAPPADDGLDIPPFLRRA